MFEKERLQQLSDADLSGLLRWAITEGEQVASARPRLARLYGILAADLRFELWLRTQPGKPERPSRQEVPDGATVFAAAQMRRCKCGICESGARCN